MRIELNTQICPIIIPDTYGSGFCYEVRDDMWEDFKQLMVDKAEEAIEEIFKLIDSPCKIVEMGKFHSPRQYNFYTDWIDFTVEIPDDYIETIKRTVRDNEDDFFRFAKERFGSYDGFSNFYPYEKDDFYKANNKDEYVLSMWIMYRIANESDIETHQKEYLDDVWDYASGNGYTIDEEDEDYE